MADSPSRLATFLSELKRRRVYRVAAVYAGVAFIISEIVANTFSYLNLPDSFGTAVIVILIIGFPIVIGLAWAFDITDKGVVRTSSKKTAEHDPLSGKPVTRKHFWLKRLTVVIIVVISVAIIQIFASRLLRSERTGQQESNPLYPLRGLVAEVSAETRPIQYSRTQEFSSEETTEPTAIRRIACLPMKNLSGNPEQDNFVDFMCNSLVIEISRIRSITVLAHQTTRQYRDIDQSISEIADQLDVDALVETSAYISADSVNIMVSLVDRLGGVIWGGEYVHRFADIFLLQREVITDIVDEIGVVLTTVEAARLADSRSMNPEALRLYQDGWLYRHEGNPASIMVAIEHLEEAVVLDPSFALAWANLGTVYALAWDMNIMSRKEAIEKSSVALSNAIHLEPDLPEVHVNLGLLIYYTGSPYVTSPDLWDMADSAFQRGIELNPNLLEAHYEYGLFLTRSGRYEEAIPHLMKAQELSPFTHHAYEGLGWTYLSMDEFDQAVEYFQIARDINLTSGFIYQGLRYSIQSLLRQEGRFDELLEWGKETGNIYALTAAYIGLGHADSAAALLGPLEDFAMPGRNGARLRAIFGDSEGAFDLLEEEFESLSLGGKRWAMSLIHGLLYDLHDHPRYQALMAQTELQY